VGPLCRNCSCHPSGAKNSDVAPRFLENICTPGRVSILNNIFMWNVEVTYAEGELKQYSLHGESLKSRLVS
jgi:hypothetical protein